MVRFGSRLEHVCVAGAMDEYAVFLGFGFEFLWFVSAILIIIMQGYGVEPVNLPVRAGFEIRPRFYYVESWIHFITEEKSIFIEFKDCMALGL